MSSWISDELDRRPKHGLTWPSAVSEALVDSALSCIIDNLTQGDDAPDDEAIPYQMLFVVDQDRAGELRDQITDLYTSNAIDLPTLASRLIGSHSGGSVDDWRLNPDIIQQLFNQIAPAGDDPWYDLPQQEVDDRDRSWPNKKRFAAGRFQRRVPDLAASGTDEPVPDEKEQAQQGCGTAEIGGREVSE